MGWLNNNNNAVGGETTNNNNRDNSFAFAKCKEDKAVAFAACNVDLERLLDVIAGAEDNGNDRY